MKFRTVFAVVAVAGAALFAAGTAAAVEPPAVPVAEVTGPIPVTEDSYPFLATDIDLSQYGYVEEEYFLEGLAYRYNITGAIDENATRIESGGPSSDGSYPFKTRIVVRRPANPADANGTVVAEWNNVTSTQDVEFNWFGDPYYLLKNGYTFVGVTAQAVGMGALKAFDNVRYGSLTLNGNGTLPADPGLDPDALSYDTFSSVLNALQGTRTGVDPLSGISAQTVIASGESQSCSRLSNHYNRIEPIHNIVDGYLLTVCGLQLRADRSDKAIRVLSELENRIPRPETTFPDTGSIRHWEVAGASHLPRLAWDNLAPTLNRDFQPLKVECQKFPLSLVEWPFTVNRATAGLVEWINGGAAPPLAPRGQYVPNPGYDPMLTVTTNNQPEILDRDRYGIARGGIRYPAVTVPTGINDGLNSPAPGGPIFSLFCGLLGSNTVFPSEQLHGLYSDFADYVSEYADATDDFLETGFILPEDADRLKAFSRQFPYLRPTSPMMAGRKQSTGRIGLNWVGTEAPDTTVTIQRKASAGKGAWVKVKGKIKGSAAVIAKDKEGTHRYRVRTSTVIPANNIAPAQTVTTPFSKELAKIKVDRSGPKAPRLVIRGKRSGGAYKGPVKVKVIGRPDSKLPDGSAGVGLNPRSVPKARTITRKGRTVIKVQTRDRLGNKSKPARAVITIR